VEVEVYRAVLEMAASEQSARMVAMRNATDAAQELIEELTLLRNKVRQEQITKELLDITGGVEAMTAH
jgi:F-type H+-transporting ATPase subunit gamma